VTVVILLGEIVPLVLLAVIVLVAGRYSFSDLPKGQPLAGASDADVAQLVAAGCMIDAIKMYCTLHGTHLKPRKRPSSPDRRRDRHGRRH
jgi:hypothetical protein